MPDRAVELVVHSAPGGGSDVFARALVDMAERERLLRQPVRVVNKTAGASTEAMAYLAARRGDDHTLAVFTNTWLATPLTRKDPAHTIREFTPIVRLVLEPTIAVVRADSPYRSLADFIEAARRNPGTLKQAGGSITAIESLTGLLLQSATGVKWSFVSTPAVSERMVNLIAGRVDIVIPQPQDANERYWQEFFAQLTDTTRWRSYVAENQVEDVFLRGPELAPFLDEQTELMRRVLREARVQ
jgi:putative tricarboxylic transport membrane protein